MSSPKVLEKIKHEDKKRKKKKDKEAKIRLLEKENYRIIVSLSKLRKEDFLEN